jgi:hypothetical protein
VEVLVPVVRERLVVDPLGEHTVEALARVEQPLLDPPPRRPLGGGALVLVPEVEVVVGERLQELAAWKLPDRRTPPAARGQTITRSARMAPL